MTLVARQSEEHLGNFEQRQETDANPEARLTADVRNEIHHAHRWLLLIGFGVH